MLDLYGPGFRDLGPDVARGGVALLACLFAVALALRPQIVGLGPLIPEIQADLDVSHAVAGLLSTIPVPAWGCSRPQPRTCPVSIGLHRRDRPGGRPARACRDGARSRAGCRRRAAAHAPGWHRHRRGGRAACPSRSRRDSVTGRPSPPACTSAASIPGRRSPRRPPSRSRRAGSWRTALLRVLRGVRRARAAVARADGTRLPAVRRSPRDRRRCRYGAGSPGSS